MKLPKQNKDLFYTVLWQDIRRVVLFFLWIAVWYLGAYSYNQNHQTYPPERLMQGWKLALWMLGAAVTGIFVFRIYRFLTDRTITGTVLESTTVRSDRAPSDTDSTADTEVCLYTKLKIRTSVGKIRRIRFEQKPNSYAYYAVGTRVVRFHGLSYPLSLDPKDPPLFACAHCGHISQKEGEFCENCGKSIVKAKNQKEVA